MILIISNRTFLDTAFRSIIVSKISFYTILFLLDIFLYKTFFFWVCIYSFLFNHSHGGHSAYYVAFGTTPDIGNFMQTKFWEPFYYYD